MEKNPKNLHPQAVEMHKQQLYDLITGFYPPDNPGERGTKSIPEIEFRKFETLEDWVGHDLMVNTIVYRGKVTGKHMLQVFEDAVQQDEWKDFEQSEFDQGYKKPYIDAQYPTPEKKEKTENRQSTGTETPRKH